MEHIFHTPNVLRNVFDSLNLGGWVVHHTPANGYIDHGFYQYSPTFFYEYYHANNFADIEIAFGHVAEGMTLVKGYVPGILDTLRAGWLDSAGFGTQCFARKTDTSSCDRIPQQNTFAIQWTKTPLISRTGDHIRPPL